MKDLRKWTVYREQTVLDENIWAWGKWNAEQFEWNDLVWEWHNSSQVQNGSFGVVVHFRFLVINNTNTIHRYFAWCYPPPHNKDQNKCNLLSLKLLSNISKLCHYKKEIKIWKKCCPYCITKIFDYMKISWNKVLLL